MKKRIFIVENHQNFSRVLEVMVNRLENFEICGIAATGEDAIEQILQSKPDLVLVDLSLPRMNGLELISRIKSRHAEIRCVVLSGHPESEYVQRALDVGADGYIDKGSPGDILEGINHSSEGERFLSNSLTSGKRKDAGS